MNTPDGEIDDGWDDFDVEEEEEEEQDKKEESDRPSRTTNDNAEGWDDNDDFFGDEDDNDQVGGSTAAPINKPAVEQGLSFLEDADAWGNDDDLNFDSDDDGNPPQTTPDISSGPTPQPKSSSKVLKNLQNYVHMLPHLQNSVTAVLQSEYNNQQKAFEVLQYFHERPGLVDYTIEKELPRMDYVVIDQSGMPLHDKEQVAAWMLQAGSQGSLLPRCANQSLLADLLQAMTGTDLLVRPQFLATAIAVSCSFVIDTLQESVMVKANLELSIPTEHQRWKIADLSVFCQLVVSTSAPSIIYRLDVVSPTEQNDVWKSQMSSAANLIENMDLPEESFLNVSYQQSPDGMDYRDAFLQQSQNLIQNSTVGLRSALKEIDAVAGISSKLSQLPAFLPQDVMDAAEREHAQVPHQLPSNAGAPQRPTSILGGFLTSGLTRLAQTVHLPEEDPEYYQQWQAEQQQKQRQAASAQRGPSSVRQGTVAPRLYNRPDQEPEASRPFSSAALHLYNRDDVGTRPQKPVAKGPQLYNRPDLQEPENMRRSTHFPTLKLYNRDDAAVDSHNSAAPGPQLHIREHVPPRQAIPAPVFTKRSNDFPTGETEHKAPVPEETIADDGWDMEDEDELFSTDELKAMESDTRWGDKETSPAAAKPPRPTESVHVLDSRTKDSTWEKDDGGTDGVPTRKRWVNPRPGPRTLEYFLTSH